MCANKLVRCVFAFSLLRLSHLYFHHRPKRFRDDEEEEKKICFWFGIEKSQRKMNEAFSCVVDLCCFPILLLQSSHALAFGGKSTSWLSLTSSDRGREERKLCHCCCCFSNFETQFKLRIFFLLLSECSQCPFDRVRDIFCKIRKIFVIEFLLINLFKGFNHLWWQKGKELSSTWDDFWKMKELLRITPTEQPGEWGPL